MGSDRHVDPPAFRITSIDVPLARQFPDIRGSRVIVGREAAPVFSANKDKTFWTRTFLSRAKMRISGINRAGRAIKVRVRLPAIVTLNRGVYLKFLTKRAPLREIDLVNIKFRRFLKKYSVGKYTWK